jgi:hypothetical protein
MRDIYLGKVTEGFLDIISHHIAAAEKVRLGVKFYPHALYEC